MCEKNFKDPTVVNESSVSFMKIAAILVGGSKNVEPSSASLYGPARQIRRFENFILIFFSIIENLQLVKISSYRSCDADLIMR